jgi:hypothetical protein
MVSRDIKKNRGKDKSLYFNEKLKDVIRILVMGGVTVSHGELVENIFGGHKSMGEMPSEYWSQLEKLSFIAAQIKDMNYRNFRYYESERYNDLLPFLEEFYIQNPECAVRDNVVFASSVDGGMKVVRPDVSQNPLDMSGVLRQRTEKVSREFLEFYMKNPSIAEQNGIKIQELPDGDYIWEQKGVGGASPLTVKLKPSVDKNYYMVHGLYNKNMIHDIK